MDRTVYYFGCPGTDTGHYWHSNESWVRILNGPDGWEGGIDGVYAPRRSSGAEAPNGQAAVAHKDGWTVLAYWDNSMDTRGGSNSAFIVKGTLDFHALLELAKEQWPWVFERQRFEVVPFQPAK